MNFLFFVAVNNELINEGSSTVTNLSHIFGFDNVAKNVTLFSVGDTPHKVMLFSIILKSIQRLYIYDVKFEF